MSNYWMSHQLLLVTKSRFADQSVLFNMIICVFCLWPSRKGKRVIFVWLYNELYWGGVTSLNLWEPPGSCPSEFHTRANPPRHYWHWENLLDVEVPHQCTLHNVYIGQYVYLATEQAETYLKICVLIYHLTYICPSLFDCEVNTFFFIFVIFKL